jgi:hypothetical protein
MDKMSGARNTDIKCMVGNLEEMPQPGNSRNRCDDNIKMGHKEIRRKDDWIHVTQDRYQ